MKFREASGRARREPGDDPPYYGRENYLKADHFLRELKKYAGVIDRQTLLTLRGQALSGDIDGAAKGLARKLLEGEKNGLC
jgi:hypothetical protein